MKFTTSEYLTLSELKSDEYKSVKEELKGCTKEDFMNNLYMYIYGVYKNSDKEVLKFESVMIVSNHGAITPWVKLIAKDCDNFYEISMNYYDSSDNFTVVYERQ